MTVSVLVVDDHDGFRHQARLLLEEAGYEVVGEAGDGTSALAAWRRLHPDVVLLDVQLPDHDGFTVARALAAEQPRPTVVLVSGRDVGDYAGRVATSGAKGFIAKADLSPEALRLVLDSDGSGSGANGGAT